MKFKVIVTILAVMMLGCEKESKEMIRPVQTAEVISLPQKLSLEYPAIVISEHETLLAFRVAGAIEKMEVEVGSFVKKGDVIAQMDRRDYEVQLKAFESKSKVAKNAYESAKAVAENARKQYQRVEVLYKEKAIPKKSYDEALAGVKAASAGELAMLSQYQEALQGVENCKNQLKDTELRAPYDGYISKKFMGEGGVVGAGIPVVAISSENSKQVRINVSERDIKGIESGTGEFIFNDKHYKLSVAEIGKVKGIGKMTYPVTFNFLEKNNGVLIDTVGMVKLESDTQGRNEVTIPVEAIFERDGKSRVWIYSNGKVTSKEVEMIAPYDNGKIIVSGVEVGDKVVTRGVHELSEEQKVNELPPFTDTNIGQVL